MHCFDNFYATIYYKKYQLRFIAYNKKKENKGFIRYKIYHSLQNHESSEKQNS